MVGDLDQGVPIQTRKAHGWTLGWFNDPPDVTAATGGVLNISRAQIGSTNIGTNKTFIASGFTTAGDRGTGAIYTSVGASPSGPMAIQDTNGVWFQLVLPNVVRAGWFGAKGDGVTNDVSPIQAAIDYCNIVNGGVVLFDTATY